ncbi:hypothetical protein [Brachyspira catarrhinii]|uniref:Lipoprotein n=1 Tax=Brachyspira catarrhinii TaxID=2528966 RepID=A0ABY2TW38_9SPIR|nr:hypothetical protein [Brachyspira catarrhinii]TKZ36191.1 hypothetical protein EZH24_01325 [Brachyspira catarrhinii]
MKTLKNLIILLIFLSLAVLLFASCKNESKTGTGDADNNNESSEITLSHYAGDWYKGVDTNPYIIINSDGSLTIKDNSDDKREASQITRNSATSYTLHDESKLNFSSDTKGTFTPQGTDAIEITKK